MVRAFPWLSRHPISYPTPIPAPVISHNNAWRHGGCVCAPGTKVIRQHHQHRAGLVNTAARRYLSISSLFISVITLSPAPSCCRRREPGRGRVPSCSERPVFSLFQRILFLLRLKRGLYLTARECCSCARALAGVDSLGGSDSGSLYPWNLLIQN